MLSHQLYFILVLKFFRVSIINIKLAYWFKDLRSYGQLHFKLKLKGGKKPHILVINLRVSLLFISTTKLPDIIKKKLFLDPQPDGVVI